MADYLFNNIDNYEGPDYAYVGSDFTSSGELSANWTATAINSGTAAILDSGTGKGVVRLSGAGTTDNSGANLQWKNESIALNAGKTTWFTTSINLSDATESDLWAGLAILDTSIIASAPTDYIMFRKDDGDAYLDAIVVRDSTTVATATALATLVAGTEYRLDIRIEMDSSTAGLGTAYFYLNGVLLQALTTSTMPYASEEQLTPSIAFQSGTATGTIYVDVDWCAARQER